MITFGSLFAGIGGFDLGFERAGMACKWQVEIDDYATRILAKHWPNVHRERDIRQCGPHNLERVDVICGGFPCQDISYAGLGAGLDGERSGLFFEAVRLVRQLRPRVVVLENVAALLTRGLDRVLGTLAQIGYDAEWDCIPAAAVGAPHIRDRVFILAHTECSWLPIGRRAKNVGTKNGKRGRVRGDVKACGTIEKGSGVSNSHVTRLEGQREVTSGTAKKFGNIGNSGWWDTEPAVGRVAHGIPHRVDRLRGLGNAVVPQVAEWIGERVVESLKQEGLTK